MLFNSLSFALFFIIFLFFYYYGKKKFQNKLLLIAGIFFYSFWNWKMSFLLLFTIYFNFKIGLLLASESIEDSLNQKQLIKKFFQENYSKKSILVFAIIINLLILFFFKYTVFSLKAWNDLSNYLFIGNGKVDVPNILLPIGISFYTFHNISYIYDVYVKKIRPTNSLLTYAVYDLFFPLLLAGPIERAEKLIPQIESDREIKTENIFSGIFLIFYGLLKKVFIADNLSIFVDKALDVETSIPIGLVFWIAPVFAFQVYADFSGYTDAARGMAKLMGFQLSLNFNHPLISTNPAEFWKRWHISLSTWLRDYVYIPLGGNKLGYVRQNINLLIVWILGGLWHGATYGYLIWGFYCGLQVVAYHWIKEKILNKFSLDQSFVFKIFSIILTFYLFSFGLLLFRVNNQEHLNRLLVNFTGIYWNIEILLKILFFISPILIVEFYQLKQNDLELRRIQNIKNPILYGLMVVFFLQFTLFSVFEKKEFFYFQF
jgi:D-alanyl-lipoteichoic acid acyltransferase DltB (MBOAT superfamily)